MDVNFFDLQCQDYIIVSIYSHVNLTLFTSSSAISDTTSTDVAILELIHFTYTIIHTWITSCTDCISDITFVTCNKIYNHRKEFGKAEDEMILMCLVLWVLESLPRLGVLSKLYVTSVV